MRMKLSLRLLVSFLIAVAATAIFAATAAAQSASIQQGLTISPFLLERQMQKGDSTDEIIDITNTSSQVLPVIISINDFIPVGDNGQEEFVDPGQGDPHYSLSSWITITSDPKPILQPGEKTSIHFTITPPTNAEDGGHYGAILFTFKSGILSGTGSEVIEKLGAIILVKLGKAVEDGQIANFSTSHSFYQYPPVSFNTRFKNTGNVHVAPRGNISIYNMFGTEVASVLVNENANNVLANTERAFASTWDTKFAFGPYRASVKLVYGDSGSVVTASTTFWILPWKTVLIYAFILLILILLFTNFLRRYNRWLLSKAYANKPVSKGKK